MNTKKFLLFCLIYFPITTFSQNVVEGYVFDQKSKKPLLGVSIFLKNTKKEVVVSDEKGFFNLILPPVQDDTLCLAQIGYKNLEISLSEIKNPLYLYLQSNEEIEAITVVPAKKRLLQRKKLGDLRNTRAGIFFRNTDYSLRYQTPMISYVANPAQKSGIIEKIFVRFLYRRVQYQAVSSLIEKKEKFYLEKPEYLKVRLFFLSAKDTLPDKELVDKPIFVKIHKYTDQWIDVSEHNIPFPKNGAFVGIQVVEIQGKDKWGDVSIPVLFTQETTYDYAYGKGKWIRKLTSQEIVINLNGKIYSYNDSVGIPTRHNHKKYSFAFGVEVAYYR